MKTIQIAVQNCQGLKDLFDQYFIWVDHQNFYHHAHEAKIELTEGGWPCIAYHDIVSINTCDSDVIVIDCITEGLHVKSKYFDLYRPDRRYLIISNSAWNPEHHSFHFEYQRLHYPFFLLDMAGTYLAPHKFCFYMNKSYDFSYPKPNVWISTVGNLKPERTKLVERLQNLSYSNYILRYSGQNLGQPCDRDVIDFKSGKFDPYIPVLPKYYHNVSQSLPINLYNQGYFNLVVESVVDSQEEFFLTEKTVKCLISGMPFVILSTPKFLQQLRAMGFETYHELWNETYDQILDHDDRIAAIVDLCENLSKFDWRVNRQKLKMIAFQNRSQFFNLHEISTQMFQRLEHAVISLDQ